MGAANCCAGRQEKDDSTRLLRSHIDSAWSFLGADGQSDIDRFDKAYKTNDIKGLVNILTSNQPIGELQSRMHSWAADPTTVGALALTQLAVLAAREDWSDVKDIIREANAIPTIVKFLNSRRDDLVHASVVALSFLTSDNSENCRVAYDNDCFPGLIKAMKSDVKGLKAAAAQICKNIYVLSLDYRETFKSLGGIPPLVQILTLPQEFSEDQPNWVHLETIYHIEDLIMNNGEELQEYLEEVKKAGAVQILKSVCKFEDSAISEAAEYLLIRMTD